MKKTLFALLFVLLLVSCAKQAITQPKNVNQLPVVSNPNANLNSSGTAPLDQTANWKTQTNTQYGFEFKYPSGFFDPNWEPNVSVGDCNYSVFPNACPNINDLVINDLAASGGDINTIKEDLAAPSYWKNPQGDKLTVNNVIYCLYHESDAGAGQVYNSYYYATVTNKKCLVVSLNTSSTNCDVYKGDTEQQINYNNCFATNQNQPKILSQIASTFKFISPTQTGCNTNSDCQNGAACMVAGPLIAGQPVHKVCVPKGTAVPL